MDANQFISLLGNAASPAIFAALFIWLFTETRKETAKREEWFRDTIKEYQTNAKAMGEAVSKMLDKLEELDQKLDRLDDWRLKQTK